MSTQESAPFVQPPAPDSSFSSVQGVTNHRTQPEGTIEARDIYAHNVVAGSQYLVQARSDQEELKDYLAFAVRDYEARMYAVLGMPSIPAHPYKFLSPFDLEDAPIFCGRHAATEELYRKVLSHRLTVLHAKSGAGKTSLLQAGLSPHFIREGRLPLYVHEYEDPALAIKRQIASAQVGPCPKLLYELPLYEFMGLVCNSLSRQTRELIIILDQFEQFFLLWPQLEARSPFIRALGDCYGDKRLRQLRFIIALRKDYYSDMEDFNQILPNLNVFQNQYRLKDMTQLEIQAVIIEPLVRLGSTVTYESTLLKTLQTDLARPGVELPLLQIICTRLYETRDKVKSQVTLKTYEALGRIEGVLSRYLNDVLVGLPNNKETLAKGILKALVRSDGLKLMLTDRILAARLEVQRDELNRVLDPLVKARLLRQERETDEIRYELVHEYLATEIVKWVSSADQAFKQVEELLQRELTNWRIHHDPIPKSRLEMLYPYRRRFKGLDAEAWRCLISSALTENFAIVDWVRTADESGELVFFQALKAFDAKIRREYIKALVKLGTSRAIELLLTTLKDGDEDTWVRRWTAEALGKLGDPQALELLLATLIDEDVGVRRWAASALGKLGDPQALEPLLAALKDEDAEVRRSAAEALGKLGDPRAVEPLLAALKDEDANVHLETVEALGKLGDPQALELLLAALKDEDVGVRRSAAEALGKLGDPRALESLLAALKYEDEDARVRRSAAEALGKLGDPQALEPLLGTLKDEDAEVRRSAAEALGKLGDSRALEPLLGALKDAEVRKWATKALGTLGDPRAVEPLLAALKNRNVEVHLEAVEALGKLGDPRALELLLVTLKDELASLRRWAAEALGELRDPRALEPLLAALKDKDARVRRRVTNALGELRDPRALELLLAALKDEDAEVQLEAVEALGKLGDPAFKLLLAALKDEDAEVRRWAAWALGELGDLRAVEPLLAVLNDRDVDMRRWAAFALRKLGDPRAVEPLLVVLQDVDKKEFQ